MQNRNKAIDGWRGIAALGVLYTHAWAKLNFPELKVFNIDILKLINIVGNGVHFFFVISGFCFCLLLEKNKIHTVKEAFVFWKRRWLRIAPAFYSIAAIIAIMNYTTLDRTLYKILANFLFLQTLVPTAEIDAIFWSLGVEWHFYLLLPAIFYLIVKLDGKIVGSVLVIFCLLLNILYYKGYFGYHEKWYYNLPANIGHFGWGIILGYFFKNRENIKAISSWKGIIIGLFIAYCGKFIYFSEVVAWAGKSGFLFKASGPLIMTMGFSILVYASLTTSSISSVIGNKFLTFVGKVSFSFYLLHYTVLSLAFYYVEPYMPRNVIGLVFLICMVSSILLPMAVFSYKIFESHYFKNNTKGAFSLKTTYKSS